MKLISFFTIGIFLLGCNHTKKMSSKNSEKTEKFALRVNEHLQGSWVCTTDENEVVRFDEKHLYLMYNDVTDSSSIFDYSIFEENNQVKMIRSNVLLKDTTVLYFDEESNTLEVEYLKYGKVLTYKFRE